MAGNARAFQQAVLSWYDRNGRKNLPWQTGRTPYAVWLSEIMLQQTQVATVIPYYLRFMTRFPDVATLSAADLDEVLSAWSGLGYYARARHLHAAAGLIMERHQGRVPADLTALTKLPGIGRSTAGAILSLGYGMRAAILDGNVKRVLSRHFGVAGWPGHTPVSRALWQWSEDLTPEARVADYNQAMMDLGATTCIRKKPACTVCPLQATCKALARGQVHELPTPKPASVLPSRTCYLLIAVDRDGKVLLTRRPPTGLWGGLWVFPEFASLEDLINGALTLGLQAGQRFEHPPRRHTFSHYHLDYTPVHLPAVDRHATGIRETPDQCWFAPGDSLAVPTPVRQLLNEIQAGTGMTE